MGFSVVTSHSARARPDLGTGGKPQLEFDRTDIAVSEWEKRVTPGVNPGHIPGLKGRESRTGKGQEPMRRLGEGMPSHYTKPPESSRIRSTVQSSESPPLPLFGALGFAGLRQAGSPVPKAAIFHFARSCEDAASGADARTWLAYEGGSSPALF